MPMSTDVKLPKTIVPDWPDRCVCCGKERPGDTLTVKTRTVGLMTLFFWWSGKFHKTVAPACRECRADFRKSRLLSQFVMLLIILVGVALAIWLLGFYYDGPGKKWIVMAIVIGCATPYILLQVAFPPVFDVTVFSKTVSYEFRDSAYAYEFAALNPGAEVE